MDKIILKCDVCNGALTMLGASEGAICEYCGMRYAIPQLREKVQEIQGKVKVEGVVQTQRADFDIQVGVLKKYHGRSVDVVIPNDVQVIGGKAFQDMKLLRSVVLPQKLVEIEDYAFSGCSRLKKINFPQRLKKIGYEAFSQCTSLTEITLPDSVTKLGDAAFNKCTSLRSITMPVCPPKSTFSIYKLCYNHERQDCWWIFENCDSLETISPPEADRYMADYYCRYMFNSSSSPWAKKIHSSVWRNQGRCQYCGGELNIITKKCKRCKTKKDY